MASVEKNLPTSKYEQLKKLPLKKLGAGLFAASAMLTACSSVSESEPTKVTETAPDSSGEGVDTTIGGGADYEGDPLQMSEEEQKKHDAEKARIDITREFAENESNNYTYIVNGEEFHGKEALIGATELLREDYPVTTQESKEALAKDFMKAYQDIFINGGLTQEEAEKFGYFGDEYDEETLLEYDYYVRGDVTEGLAAARHSTYQEVFLRSVTQGVRDTNSFDGLYQRSQDQYEAFRTKGELAELEVTGVADVSSTYEPGQTALLIEVADNMSEDGMRHAYEVVFELSPDQTKIVATKFSRNA